MDRGPANPTHYTRQFPRNHGPWPLALQAHPRILSQNLFSAYQTTTTNGIEPPPEYLLLHARHGTTECLHSDFLFLLFFVRAKFRALERAQAQQPPWLLRSAVLTSKTSLVWSALVSTPSEFHLNSDPGTPRVLERQCRRFF